MWLKILLKCALVSCFYYYCEGASCPSITSRDEWGALDGTTQALTTYPPTYVVIHHSKTPSCVTREDCMAVVKSMQKHHVHIQSGDIEYNFLVGEDGNVYEGVGWNRAANHTLDYNTKSLGICIIGDYTSRLPKEETLQAIKDLVDCAESDGFISQDYRIIGHRQIENKDCPGLKLYQQISRWSRWKPY